MTNRSVNHTTQQGFTLIQLVVVLVLISILAAFVAPRWIGTKPNLYAQTQQLLSDIRYTQNLAMTQGKRYRLNLITPNSYTISDTSGTIVKNPSAQTNTVSLGTGLSFGTFTNLPNSLIAFDEQGVPYTNSTATTALSSNATIVLSSGSRTNSIVIYPNTGKATAQ